MGVISTFTFTSDDETVTRAKLNNLVSNIVTEFNGNIDNANIKAAANIAYSKLNLTSSVVKTDLNSAIFASEIQATTGEDNDVIMTPLRVKQAIEAYHA
jgi:hypothetical protein